MLQSDVLLLMVAVTLINVIVAQVRVSHALAKDMRRLRSALRTELEELLTLYLYNIGSLRERKSHILSSRSCTSVFRGCIGRICSISDREIEPLVRAYTVSERTEHLIAATTKAHGAMAFKIESETPVEELIGAMERSTEAIRKALLAVRSQPGCTDTE